MWQSGKELMQGFGLRHPLISYIATPVILFSLGFHFAAFYYAFFGIIMAGPPEDARFEVEFISTLNEVKTSRFGKYRDHKIDSSTWAQIFDLDIHEFDVTNIFDVGFVEQVDFSTLPEEYEEGFSDIILSYNNNISKHISNSGALSSFYETRLCFNSNSTLRNKLINLNYTLSLLDFSLNKFKFGNIIIINNFTNLPKLNKFNVLLGKAEKKEKPVSHFIVINDDLIIKLQKEYHNSILTVGEELQNIRLYNKMIRDIHLSKGLISSNINDFDYYLNGRFPEMRYLVTSRCFEYFYLYKYYPEFFCDNEIMNNPMEFFADDDYLELGFENTYFGLNYDYWSFFLKKDFNMQEYADFDFYINKCNNIINNYKFKGSSVVFKDIDKGHHLDILRKPLSLLQRIFHPINSINAKLKHSKAQDLVKPLVTHSDFLKESAVLYSGWNNKLKHENKLLYFHNNKQDIISEYHFVVRKAKYREELHRYFSYKQDPYLFNNKWKQLDFDTLLKKNNFE